MATLQVSPEGEAATQVTLRVGVQPAKGSSLGLKCNSVSGTASGYFVGEYVY